MCITSVHLSCRVKAGGRLFDSDLLWPFSALPPHFLPPTYVSASKEFSPISPNNSKKHLRVCTPKLESVFFFFFSSCFIKNKLQPRPIQGHNGSHNTNHDAADAVPPSTETMASAGESTGKAKETMERTDYSEADNSSKHQASYAGLHKRLLPLKGMASKQGIVANTSNQ